MTPIAARLSSIHPAGPGARALITLPEVLTEAEAKRLAKFVEALAVPDQRAITTGEVPAEYGLEGSNGSAGTCS